MDSDARLCEVCSNIFTEDVLDGIIDLPEQEGPIGARAQMLYRLHHDNLQSVQASVTSGCDVCSMLQHHIDPMDYKQSVWYVVKIGSLPSLYLMFRNFTTGDVLKDTGIQLKPVESVDTTSITLAGQAAARQDYTGSDEGLDLVQCWLSKCTESHSNCKRHQKTDWWPKRLLHLKGPTVQLVETSMPQHSVRLGPYATLSHCWGAQSFPVLTSSNADMFREGVKISYFPQTFQDAMKTCLHLGIAYLWVDCYCIIQGGVHSIADWAAESATMKLVYSHSLLNIAPSDAASPHEGCFRKRDPRLRPRRFVTWRRMVATVPLCYEIFDTAGVRDHLDVLSQAPIFKRAWIMQERLLCHRMLYFGPEQIYWECSGDNEDKQHFLAWEDYPSGQLTDASRLPPWTLDRLGFIHLFMGGMHSLWAEILDHYTQLELSHPDADKLMAIGGIAQLLADRYGDDYISGLFRKRLVAQLQWHPSTSTTSAPNRRSALWRAPSWSWASEDGPCVFNFSHLIEVVGVVAIEQRSTDPENQYGRLEWAKLMLHGRALVAVLMTTTISYIDVDIPVRSFSSLRIGEHEIHWVYDDVNELERQWAAGGSVVVLPTQIGGMPMNRHQQQDDLTLEEILALDENSVLAEQNKISITIQGLVLRPNTNSTYTRLGVLFLVSPDLQARLSLVRLWAAQPECEVTIL